MCILFENFHVKEARQSEGKKRAAARSHESHQIGKIGYSCDDQSGEYDKAGADHNLDQDFEYKLPIQLNSLTDPRMT